ncbi:multicopper oxidase family protein [Streptosporangium sandarakinum]|uniref:multicopper oxidase family protein n=1 Tax=Streptosporangium sandarakinum TaxID=1260955 RepID=UPI0034466DE3
MNRRNFLTLATLAAVGTACGSEQPDTWTTGGRLPIPPLYAGRRGEDGVRRFTLNLQRGQTEFLPGKRAATWGVNGSYLGPTLRVTRGDTVAMRVNNQVGEATTLHWHGMRLPARMDGGPHQMIEPDAAWTPRWTVDQPAATSWYHPHPHERTAMHVYRGLAGMFLIDDPRTVEPALPRRYGEDDIPLVIQDKRFTDDGALHEAAVDTGTFGFLGDKILVNGRLQPTLQVTTTLVRFRLLNASNARVYRIGFADDRRFQLIATDAGLLPEPADLDRLKLSPGERAEIVATFAGGEQVFLDSVGEDGDSIERDDFNLLRIIAAETLTAAAPLPRRLSDDPLLQPPPGARVRRFVLSGKEINGKPMDMTRVDEVVPAGATEIWELDNTTYAHNFHIHEVAFRVLALNGAPPPAHLRGHKDTVFVPKRAKVRLAVSFGSHTDPSSPYMYHCHLLRHEDQGMMGQFVIVPPGTEHRTPLTLPAASHHG